jgi:dTDP-4-dehydrorhamnose reductase
VIVNAAAHTAVDKAESEPELARAINATAPGVLAREAARTGAWLLHYSTDYVFDGSGDRPRAKTRPPARSASTAAPSSKASRLIRASGCRHLILRTSWVYAARGGNFAKHHAAAGGRARCAEASSTTRWARPPAPTCWPTSARTPCARSAQPALAGTYHCVAGGETSWHGYARFVIEWARAHGHALKVAPDACAPSPPAPTPRRRGGRSIRAWTPQAAGRLRPAAAALAARRRAHAHLETLERTTP